MDELKYLHTAKVYYGIIVGLKSGSVEIDLKGRLGNFNIPIRMLISENPPKIGQEVGFYLSYPEVISEAIDEKHLENIKRSRKNEI